MGETFQRMRLLKTGWDDPLVEQTADVATLTPTDDQVIVAVEACGVCHRDLIDREGRFPFLQLPITPGHEAVGRVIFVGARVGALRIGDRVATMHRDHCGECAACRASATSLCDRAAHVFGILADGGYATRLVAPESSLYRADDTMSPEEAAVLHCTFGTAYRDLVTLGGLTESARVLVTGANGGVGAAAVQIAARLGAEVIGVVRDERHVAFVRALGAHEVVVDSGASFHEQVAPVDLALDAVGFSTFSSTLRALRIGGRVVVVGNVEPKKVALNLGFVITRGLSIVGGSGATLSEMERLLSLHRARPFASPIDRALPLARADEAQRWVRAGGLHGRIVLRM